MDWMVNQVTNDLSIYANRIDATADLFYGNTGDVVHDFPGQMEKYEQMVATAQKIRNIIESIKTAYQNDLIQKQNEEQNKE